MDFDLLFADERENGPTRLRQCQLVMLRMLKILDYLCTKHDIQYFLVGGTLLGAVRHQGFIPWDDDLDVAMTRENYEKFLKYAAPELPHDIFLQNRETDNFYPACHLVDAKLRDKYSSYIRSESDCKKYKWHSGLQVDLFIYDRAFLPHNFFIFVQNRFFWRLRKKHEKLRPKFLKFVSKYVPLPFVYASNFVYDKQRMRLGTSFLRKSEISKLKKVKFEDMEAYIPMGWHKILKRQYGDYMQLPPEEKRVGLHSEDLPDPFTPCNHKESLNWQDRKVTLENHVL